LEAGEAPRQLFLRRPARPLVGGGPRAGKGFNPRTRALQAAAYLLELGTRPTHFSEGRFDPFEAGDPVPERIAGRAGRFQVGPDAADGLRPLLEGPERCGEPSDFLRELGDRDSQALAELHGLLLKGAS